MRLLHRILQRADRAFEVLLGHLKVELRRHLHAVADPGARDMGWELVGKLGFAGRPQILPERRPRLRGAFHSVSWWDGSSWQPLGNLNGNSPVVDLLDYNGQLVAAGSFLEAGVGTNKLARLVDSSWEPFEGSGTGDGSLVLESYNGELVAGGSFLTAGDKVSARLAWWRAACGDVNGDGSIDIDDLLAVISAWGPCSKGSPCLMDVNSDGQVNIDDLLLVINNWG